MTSIQTVAARKETVSLELATKIDGIRNGCSKPYFSNALKRMGDSNPENCAIICDYILAEQIEINLKDST
jgi:hypothetical protein